MIGQITATSFEMYLVKTNWFLFDYDRSELEVLEKDMQTLRDTIIAREEAWDKAMEREHNYRQQLTRLTTETITARHLSDTRYEELKTATNALQVTIEKLHSNKEIALIFKRHLVGWARKMYFVKVFEYLSRKTFTSRVL